MPIRFVCPVCWTVREGVDDALLGKMVKCQDCHAMAVAVHTPPPHASAAQQKVAVAQPIAAATRHVPAERGIAAPVTTRTGQETRPTRVLFSSGDVPYQYDVVDLVFAHGNSAEGDMKGMAPVQAFQMLVNWLGQTALQIGANAVINIRLEFRVAGGQGLLGAKQAFEVYGYGTAVKVSA